VCTSLNILLPSKADLRCPLCQNMNVIFRTLFKLSWKTIYLYQGQNVNNEIETVTLLLLRNRKLDYLEKMCFYAHYVCFELNPKFSVTDYYNFMFVDIKFTVLMLSSVVNTTITAIKSFFLPISNNEHFSMKSSLEIIFQQQNMHQCLNKQKIHFALFEWKTNN
jgi:hypothetical protein